MRRGAPMPPGQSSRNITGWPKDTAGRVNPLRWPPRPGTRRRRSMPQGTVRPRIFLVAMRSRRGTRFRVGGY